MNAAKERGGEGLHKHKEVKEEEEMLHQNYLDLRLGVSPNNNNTINTSASNREAEDSKKVVLMTSFGGFVHPWSLAARQQKAAFEQAHHMSNPSSSALPARFATPPRPPTIGWPPVRTVRRNSVVLQPTKCEIEGEKEEKKLKMTHETEDRTKIALEARPTLFVKVNMEGFAIGRKINLKAHPSYDSLSQALQKMFDNFLSANYNYKSTEEEQVDSACTDHILLYEDHEGDRMLVGDVPWEMFIATVKRLYIAHNPKSRKNENKKEADGNKSDQGD